MRELAKKYVAGKQQAQQKARAKVTPAGPSGYSVGPAEGSTDWYFQGN